MKKVIIITMLVVMTIGGASAQDLFFPSKEGTTLLYANLNGKGKVDGYTRQTIQKVEGSGNNMSITYVSQALDKKRRQIGDTPVEIPLTITVTDGVLEWDMKSFASPGTEGFTSIEGDKLRIPSTLSPGSKLDDVKFTMTLNMGFKIRTEVLLTDQQCLAIEDVTVPAGVFKCHKVTQTNTSTVMRKTTTMTIITWYAPGIGTVKQETYNAKGKLQTAMQLEAIEN